MIIHTVTLLFNPHSADKSSNCCFQSKNGETGHKHNLCNHHKVFAPQAGAMLIFNFFYLVWANTMTWWKQNKGCSVLLDAWITVFSVGSIQTSSPDYRDTNSAQHCFITTWWLKLVYSSTVQRRSCIVCSGSSKQHPGDSLPWVTPVSDTLSAAYMPPTPPLLHPSLSAFSLFPLCTVLPPLLS